MTYTVQITVTLPSTGENYVKVLGSFDRRDYAEGLARAMSSHGASAEIVESR